MCNLHLAELYPGNIFHDVHLIYDQGHIQVKIGAIVHDNRVNLA
jgi:hypothetical protein